MMKLFSIFAINIIITTLTSCQSIPPRTVPEPMPVNGLGLYEILMTANNMVDSILTFPPIVQVTEQRRPVVYVHHIKNKTMEHIDTESLTDSISTRMIQSGKFRFTDMTVVEEILKQQDWQNTEFVDPTTATKFGRLIGAEYMLYGNLSGNVNRIDSRRKLIDYKLTLKFLNVETGIVEWQDEQAIVKEVIIPVFGR